MFDVATNWLIDFKKHIKVSDSIRDNLLVDYLNIARENIWTQYLDGDLPIDDTHPWAHDRKMKMASFHLATTYFENPDIFLQSKDVKSDRMLFFILGERVAY